MSDLSKDNSQFLSSPKDLPSCFGDPRQVCPRDETGIIQPQAHCLSCEHVKRCLRQALEQQGVLSKPLAQAPVVSRISRFLKRWSDQKLGKE